MILRELPVTPGKHLGLAVLVAVTPVTSATI
jgi:hypothetical protein